MIFAAFMEQYKIDLLSESLNLHWYKFRALLEGLHDTPLNEVMKIRSWQPKANDTPEYKAQMQKLYNAWKIVPPLTSEETAKIAEFDALF